MRERKRKMCDHPSLMFWILEFPLIKHFAGVYKYKYFLKIELIILNYMPKNIRSTSFMYLIDHSIIMTSWNASLITVSIVW